ncbi:MAG TPA: DUF4388 domain-containing protein [Gemmatimonadales bacterium]
MHGPLSEIGLIEVLQLLERGKRSGVLRVSRSDVDPPCLLRITDGAIVAVEPDAGDEATRRALIDRHVITSTDARDDAEVLRRPRARAMRTRLAHRAITAMLHWHRGRFDFQETAPADGALSISTDDLVFALVAAETRRVELAPVLDEFHVVPAFVPADQLAAGAVPALVPLDWRILDRVDGVRDLSELAAALDEPLEEVAERIQSLCAATILELRPARSNPLLAARMALEARRYEEAARLLRDRLAAHPHDAESWRALGLAEIGAGRFEDAIDAWRSWQQDEPDRRDEATALMQAARTMMEALRDARD